MTGPLVAHVLGWLVPPVLGALIGAAVNALAMRMLFRSRSRHAVALALGRLVSGSIVTEKALRSALHSEPAGQRIQAAISSLSDSVLSLPLAKVAEKGRASLRETMEDTLSGLLLGVFSSRAMINGLRGILADLAASWCGRRTTDILESLGWGTMVSGRLLPFLANPARRERLSQGLAAVLADKAGDILSDEVIAGLATAAEPLLPVAAERLAAWLQTEDVRTLLAARGRELIPRILEKLNELQRFLLSAAQYDRRLTEKMPEIVDDTVRTLQEIARDPVQQRKLLALGAGILRDWRKALKAEGGSVAPGGARAGLKTAAASLLARGLSLLDDAPTGAGLADALTRGLLAPNQTLGAFLRESFGLQEPQIVDFLAERALRFLTAPATSQKAGRALSGFLLRYLDDHSETTIGALLRVDPARKERIDSFLAARLVGLVDGRLPELVQGLDVESLVARKIDSLDVKAVGGRPTRRVILLGAGLGFVVGLVPLGLKLLGVS